MGWCSQFGWNFSLSELYPNQVGVSAKILQPNMSSESLPGAPLTKGARATLHLGRDKERWNKGEREGGGADKGAHPTPPCAPGLTCCLLMALFSVNMPPLGGHVGVNTNYGKLLRQPGTLYCHMLGLLFTLRCCLSALFLRSLGNQPKNCTTIGPTAPRGHGTHLS